MHNKPLIFVDLDDTLFQTHRRIQPDATFRVATLDISGQPLSFMKPKQQQLVDWMFSCADVVPVTARSVDSLHRVQLNFEHGAICTHGGVVLNPSKQIDEEWQEIQKAHLNHVHALMQQLPEILQHCARDLGEIRTWYETQDQLNIYAVAKQKNLDLPLFLKDLVQLLPQEIQQHFYVHTNGNNLALIPNAISKKSAVEYYLKKYDPEQQRVILGFGDSLSDFGFLSSCDWFGMPKSSQLHQFTESALQQDYQTKGFFGHA